MYRLLFPFSRISAPFGIAGGSPGGIRYILLDRFTTNASAPLPSPRACEPGPGSLNITDSANLLSITGGELTIASGAGAPQVVGAASQARKIGRALWANVKVPAVGDFIAFGWYSGGIVGNWWFNNGHQLTIQPNPANPGESHIVRSGGTPYDIKLGSVMRSSGQFFIDMTANKLLWVSTEDNSAVPGTWFLYSAPGQGSLDNLSIADWGGVWASDYGLATNRVASPVSPASTTMLANSWNEFTWTPQSGETLEFDVRRTDADNRWIVRCSQVGGTVKLIERNASVETERGSSAQVWTIGTPYRIVVSCDGNTIYISVANIDRISYASASFNNTATGVQVAGFASGSNLVCWGVDISSHIPVGA